MLCTSCLNKLIPKFTKFKIDCYDGLAIYDYDDNIRSLLYQFKGCYDIELANVFLYRYISELSMRYKGYTITHVPSYHKEDEERGFNHVVEMFRNINLKSNDLIKKVTPYKQADHNKRDRTKIKEHLIIENVDLIRNKKILIVDDVMTTGSTLKAMVDLINQGHPKTIKILVMSKRAINEI